jgi:hypothetical protein
MRNGIVTANLEEYADPRVAVRLARAAEAAGWEAFFGGTTSASCGACRRGIHGSSCPRLRTPRSALAPETDALRAKVVGAHIEGH